MHGGATYVQGIVLDKNTHLIETVRSVSILQSRSCMAAASSQPAPPARNKSDTWRVRAAQLQVTTPQHPPGWRSRFARISGPRPGSCGCPICNLVLTVSMSAELLGTPHASGKKKRKSSSSPQTDAALKRCSLSPQAVTVSNAVTFSPLRGSLARVMASAAATTSTHAQKKHCRDGRQHNRGRPSRHTCMNWSSVQRES